MIVLFVWLYIAPKLVYDICTLQILHRSIFRSCWYDIQIIKIRASQAERCGFESRTGLDFV